MSIDNLSTKWTINYLGLAKHIAEWSKDPSTKCGAIAIGKHMQILSVGFNGFPRKIEDTAERLNDRPTKYSLMVHAEIPQTVGVAFDENGLPKKDTLGLFLDDYYNEDRNKSNILKLNRKIFSEDILNESLKLNAYFNHIKQCNSDSTLVNYYMNGTNYSSHLDGSCLTCVTFFSLGNFKGGNFCFTDYDIEIEFKENRTVIFPGCIKHEAKPIIAEDDNYRISIAQFLNYRT